MYHRKLLLSLLGLALTIISVPSIQAGTGVGGSDSGLREERIRKITDAIGPRRDAKHLDLDEVLEWCDKADRILTAQRFDAELLFRDGEYDQALSTLVDALVALSDSLQTDPEEKESVRGRILSAGPRLKVQVDRALEIARALDEAIPDSSTQTLKTKFMYLFEYTKLIEDSTYRYDREYFLPFYYRYRKEKDYGHFDIKAFELEHLRFATRQLEFLTEPGRFLDSREIRVDEQDRDDHRRVAYMPIGSPRAFLIVSQLVASFVSEDIQMNLFAGEYICTIERLDELESALRDFNKSGFSRRIRGTVSAVAFTVEQLMRAKEEMLSEKKDNDKRDDHDRDGDRDERRERGCR